VDLGAECLCTEFRNTKRKTRPSTSLVCHTTIKEGQKKNCLVKGANIKKGKAIPVTGRGGP
jgi:hypothetical protein